jgi:riboflavin biosynthesis pyrimidine reductase
MQVVGHVSTPWHGGALSWTYVDRDLRETYAAIQATFAHLALQETLCPTRPRDVCRRCPLAHGEDEHPKKHIVDSEQRLHGRSNIKRTDPKTPLFDVALAAWFHGR